MRFALYKNLVISILGILMVSNAALGQRRSLNISKIPAGADRAAWELLESADDTTYYLTNIEGFEAEVIVDDNGLLGRGKLRYDVYEGADLQMKGLDEKTTWPVEMILNILRNLRRPKFGGVDGRWPITFAKDDHSPLGRQVLLHDGPVHSSYRIRNGRITEAKRSTGEDCKISRILEEIPAGEGKYIPRHFTVTFIDSKSHLIKKFQAFTDEYRKIEGVWFPFKRQILWAENGEVILRSIELNNPKIRFR
jgi:uncharacterized protein DUF3386